GRSPGRQPDAAARDEGAFRRASARLPAVRAPRPDAAGRGRTLPSARRRPRPRAWPRAARPARAWTTRRGRHVSFWSVKPGARSCPPGARRRAVGASELPSVQPRGAERPLRLRQVTTQPFGGNDFDGGILADEDRGRARFAGAIDEPEGHTI